MNCGRCDADLTILDDERQYECESCERIFCDLCFETTFKHRTTEDCSDSEDEDSWIWYCEDCAGPGNEWIRDD